MVGLEPEQGVGIEQDQRRTLEFLLKRNPSALQLHCHTPLATAGSTISMIGLRRVIFVAAWRSGCTRNRTPRRSMTTDSPRSAASRRRENRCFAVAAVNRFMIAIIQFSGALEKHASRDGRRQGSRNVNTSMVYLSFLSSLAPKLNLLEKWIERLTEFLKTKFGVPPLIEISNLLHPAS
jgi:hypothetical protein